MENVIATNQELQNQIDFVNNPDTITAIVWYYKGIITGTQLKKVIAMTSANIYMADVFMEYFNPCENASDGPGHSSSASIEYFLLDCDTEFFTEHPLYWDGLRVAIRAAHSIIYHALK